jgi:hypothetical protein
MSAASDLASRRKAQLALLHRLLSQANAPNHLAQTPPRKTTTESSRERSRVSHLSARESPSDFPERRNPVADDRAIVHIEWRPLTLEDSFDATSSLGSVMIERRDGTTEEQGPMTRADTARLAAELFDGTGTRISVGGRVVAWIARESAWPNLTMGPSLTNEK